MGFSWAAKNLSPIGVDLGTDSVKLLQVTGDDPPQLVAAASADIPEAARKDGESHRQFVSQALRDLVREGKFKGKRAVASISAAHTYVQHVRLAKADGAMLDQQIELELRGRLPLDPTGMVVRHVSVGEVFADGSNKQEVICLAASRESIMRTVTMSKSAGLNIVGMHCEPMAILASFKHLFRRNGDEGRTTLFVDIGAATTKAMIAHGDRLVFAKTIHVGGDHFIRQIAASDSLSLGEARARRIRDAAKQQDSVWTGGAPAAALPASDRRREGSMIPTAMGAAIAAAPAAVAQPLTASPRISAADGEMLDCLIDELQLCGGYHASMFHERAIEKIVFLGGESRQIAMCQRIAQALRLPAQLGDPLVRVIRNGGSAAPIGVDLRQPQPGWSVPLGLCLLPTNL